MTGCRVVLEREKEGRDRDRALVYLRDRNGADMAEWPADLRVREFPR